MNYDRLKNEMKSLWKETFGDSAEYVSLVFDTYFSPERVFWHEEEGKLQSALTGVPYTFSTAEGRSLQGLYLCGLSTRTEYRGKGIMSDLIEKANRMAEEKGYDFTFLIPSSEGIRRYYKDRGYHDAFFKIKDHYVRGHKFESEGGTAVAEYRPEDIREVKEYLLANETKDATGEWTYRLRHTDMDWEAALREAEISNEPVYVCRREGRITGVAFTKNGEEGVEVKKIIANDNADAEGLLQGIMRINPQRNISVCRDLTDLGNRGQLWSPFYARNNRPESQYENVSEVETPYDVASGAYPFGMIRILNIENFLEKNGLRECEALKGFSPEEIIDLLLRKGTPSNDDSLKSMLDIPEVAFSMSLLLE